MLFFCIQIIRHSKTQILVTLKKKYGEEKNKRFDRETFYRVNVIFVKLLRN